MNKFAKKASLGLALILTLAMMLQTVVFLPASATDAVAKIGDTEYATLAEAVASVENGDVVVLQNDTTEDVIECYAKKSFKIDLNGYTWTANNGVALIGFGTETSFPEIEIFDSVGTGVITNEGTTGTIPPHEDPTALIDFATHIITLSGGKLISKGRGLPAIGGQFKGSITLAGADVETDSGLLAEQMLGGTPLATKLIVTGGTLNANPTAYVPAEGYTVTNNGNGTWTVAPEVAAVATIGEVGYESLAAAVAAVENGDVIVLQNDTTENLIACNAICKSFKIDLNGYTWTANQGVAIGGMIGFEGNICAFEILDSVGTGVITNAGTTATPSQSGYDGLFDFSFTDVTLSGGTLINSGRDMPAISGQVMGSITLAGANVVTDNDLFAYQYMGSGSAFATKYIVTGGTLNANPTAYVPAGYVVTNNGNGTWTVTAEAAKVAKIGDEKFETLADAFTAATAGQTITLIDDATIDAEILVNKKVTLNLNGFDVATNGVSAFCINGGNLTVTGEGTISGTPANYKLIYFYGSTDANAANYSVLTLNKDVTVECPNGYAVMVSQKSGCAYGVVFNTSATINSAYGIYVNGSVAGTGANVVKFNINGGSIISDGTSVYLAGVAKTTISGDTVISGGGCGVEMRAGELVIESGTITSTAAAFSCVKNGNGSTTVGAALVIAQHTTKKDMSLTINGGTFTGIKSLFECNVEENDPAPHVQIAVNGGTFNGAVEVEDTMPFINGGMFNAEPTAAYIADGLVAIEVTEGVLWTVGADKKAQQTEVKEDTSGNIEVVITDKDSGEEVDLTLDTEVKDAVVTLVTENKATNSFYSTNVTKAVEEKIDAIKEAIKQVISEKVAEAAEVAAQHAEVDAMDDASMTTFVQVKATAAVKAQVEEEIVFKRVTFDVKPIVQTTVAGESYDAVIPNSAIEAPITFRLPVQSSVPTGRLASVYHEGEYIGEYAVKEEAGSKFIEISSKNFSEFSYDFAETTTDLTLVNQGITLADNISFVFTVNNENGFDNVGVIVTFFDASGASVQTTITRGTAIAGNKIEFTFSGITPERMNDELWVEVIGTKGNKSYKTGTYKGFSVKNYCTALLASEYAAQWNDVVVNLLAYGAAAQTYTGYDTANLANAGVASAIDFTDEINAPITYSDRCILNAVGENPATIENVSLILGNAVTMRVFFTLDGGADISKVTATANGKKITSFGTEGGQYYFDCDTVNAADFDKGVELRLAYNGAADDSLNVTVNYYLNYVINNSADEALVAIACAAFNYGYAANVVEL